MDGQVFDNLARALAHGLSRRRLAAALAMPGLVAGVGAIGSASAKKHKKKKRKKCKPKCTGGAKCKKRKCVCPSGRKLCDGQCIPSDTCCADTEECGCPSGQKPCGEACIPQDDCCDATEECGCGNGLKDCHGACIPATDCCDDEDCSGGATCQDGTCNCPAGEQVCDGVCFPAERICGEVCCPEEVECFAGGCACEDFVCSCDEELTFCSTPDDDQCCAPGDDCDPVFGCTADICTADNAVCTLGEAFCGDGACLCATNSDGAPFCADFSTFDCPASSACSIDDECGTGESCVDVSCCGDGSVFLGVCLPPCAATLRSSMASAEQDRLRRQIKRMLNRDVAGSRSRRRETRQGR